MTVLLLATPEADRFFLVPAGEALADGDLLLVTATGEERRVAPDAVAPFEATREQARGHVRAEAQRAMDGVADALARALGVSGQEPPDLHDLADRLGVAGGDRAATEAAIRALAADTQAVVAAIASGGSSDLAEARARLAARGIDVGDELAGLRRLGRDDAADAAAAGLRALAAELETPGDQPLGRRLDALIERLEREVGPFLGRDPERVREQRRQQYERDARSSIADALRESGITPLNEPD